MKLLSFIFFLILIFYANNVFANWQTFNYGTSYAVASVYQVAQSTYPVTTMLIDNNFCNSTDNTGSSSFYLAMNSDSNWTASFNSLPPGGTAYPSICSLNIAGSSHAAYIDENDWYNLSDRYLTYGGTTGVSISNIAYSYNGKTIAFVPNFIHDCNGVDCESLVMSTDFGQTWFIRPYRYGYSSTMKSVSISDNGTMIVVWDGQIHKSTDSGMTFVTPNITSSFTDMKFKMSGDGKYQIRFVSSYSYVGINISTDYGTTWSYTPLSGVYVGDVGISRDGKYIVVVNANDVSKINLSSDYGSTWSIKSTSITGSSSYVDIELSDNGRYMLLGASGKKLATSWDYGNSFQNITTTAEDWRQVAIDGAGRVMLARRYVTGQYDRQLYYSLNSGTNVYDELYHFRISDAGSLMDLSLDPGNNVAIYITQKNGYPRWYISRAGTQDKSKVMGFMLRGGSHKLNNSGTLYNASNTTRFILNATSIGEAYSVNYSSSRGIFVPAKTSTEFQSFYNNPPPNVSVSTDTCVSYPGELRSGPMVCYNNIVYDTNNCGFRTDLMEHCEHRCNFQGSYWEVYSGGTCSSGSCVQGSNRLADCPDDSGCASGSWYYTFCDGYSGCNYWDGPCSCGCDCEGDGCDCTADCG